MVCRYVVAEAVNETDGHKGDCVTLGKNNSC